DMHFHFHRALKRAVIIAAYGRHVAVISSVADFHIGLVNLAIVRRVERAPALVPVRSGFTAVRLPWTMNSWKASLKKPCAPLPPKSRCTLVSFSQKSSSGL